MITKMNYLLLSTVMVVAIDSTFCRGCDCCKKLCADQDSSESYINNVDNNTNVNEKTIQKNEIPIHINNNDNIISNNNFTKNIGNNNNFYNTNKNNNTIPENLESNDNSNHKKIMHYEKFNSKKVNENENEETLYFKIDKDANDENIEKCFNGSWYKACGNKVLLLQEVDKGDEDVLEVTGSGNNWKITDQGKKVLGDAGCKPNNNKWIIVKVTTRNGNTENAGDSYIFYVDEIKSVKDDYNKFYGVFDSIECYSIEIIAANTRAVESMFSMFFKVESALEKDMKKNAAPGLIGLDKLNVENVYQIHWMFYNAIHKQATLKQLEKWRFSGKHGAVSITELFNSRVEGLNFKVLDGWNKTEDDEPVVFYIAKNYSLENVFVQSGKEKNFTAPRWYGDINKVE